MNFKRHVSHILRKYRSHISIWGNASRDVSFSTSWDEKY